MSNETRPAMNSFTAIGQADDPSGPVSGPVELLLDCRHFDHCTGKSSPCVVRCRIDGQRAAAAAMSHIRRGKTVIVSGHLVTDADGSSPVLNVIVWQFAEPKPE